VIRRIRSVPAAAAIIIFSGHEAPPLDACAAAAVALRLPKTIDLALLADKLRGVRAAQAPGT
jgi:hypothetical protein